MSLLLLFGAPAGANVTATPDAAALALTPFAPTISASDHVTATPDVASLALTTFEPTVAASDHITVTPGVVALATSSFAPTVTASDHVTAVTDPVALTITLYAPNVTVSGASIAWTTPADTVLMSASPELKFTMPSAASPLFFELQIDTAATFDTGDLRDYRSDQSQTGWAYWNGADWADVTAAGVDESYGGSEARYTVQTPLTTGTWYRRVRAGT
jgi:hypothetical protein